MLIRNRYMFAELLIGGCERTMAHYSLLMLDSANEVISSGICRTDEDEAAMAAARVWLSKHPAVEVWKGPNLVATVTSNGVAASLNRRAGQWLGNRATTRGSCQISTQ